MTKQKKYALEITLGAGLLVATGLAVSSGASDYRKSVQLDPQYVAECGSCHLPYSPQLLPAKSWQALMGSLDDHFGDNAEMTPELTQAIGDYLDTHAAHAGKRANSDSLRITETRWFRKEHDEVPRRLVQDNPEVRSFSQCDSCHEDAARGHFDEDTVSIPGHGRWDD
jgi:hypothetical protein